MKYVGLRTGSWSAEGLVLTESFLERFRGVNLSAAARGVVIRCSAVHTMGMSGAIETVAVDRQGRVVEARTLAPNRFAWFRGARYLVELPGGTDVPEVGSVVEVTHVG
ncbi:MAG: hypothetical protein ACFCU2_09320 [Acidimicrobiia bacterium]